MLLGVWVGWCFDVVLGGRIVVVPGVGMCCGWACWVGVIYLFNRLLLFVWLAFVLFGWLWVLVWYVGLLSALVYALDLRPFLAVAFAG